MEQGGEKMIGIYKLLISILIIVVAVFLRSILIEHLGGFSSEESDFHYKLCLCILLAAWIVREGLW